MAVVLTDNFKSSCGAEETFVASILADARIITSLRRLDVADVKHPVNDLCYPHVSAVTTFPI